MEKKSIPLIGSLMAAAMLAVFFSACVFPFSSPSAGEQERGAATTERCDSQETADLLARIESNELRSLELTLQTEHSQTIKLQMLLPLQALKVTVDSPKRERLMDEIYLNGRFYTSQAKETAPATDPMEKIALETAAALFPDNARPTECVRTLSAEENRLMNFYLALLSRRVTRMAKQIKRLPTENDLEFECQIPEASFPLDDGLLFLRYSETDLLPLEARFKANGIPYSFTFSDYTDYEGRPFPRLLSIRAGMEKDLFRIREFLPDAALSESLFTIPETEKEEEHPGNADASPLVSLTF